MVDARFKQWLIPLVCLVVLLSTEALFVDITYVQDAVAKGAVCLDGSPPAYHLDRGSGTGINNWLIQLEGGGWCNNVSNCVARMRTHLGSSKQMAKQIAFSAILSNKRQYNPDFYNWNRVKIRYCDGSSFTGDVQTVNPDTDLHFRGGRVWLAVMEDLLAKGMRNAENAVLSGCSAGGLASMLHCDSFRALLPMGTKVKCISDAGFFLNTRDVSGVQYIRQYFNDVVTLHGSAKNLPLPCTSRLNPALCFFPQYVAQHIRTPLFILNAAYDSWQIKNILAPRAADPSGKWQSCELDIKNCQPNQLKVMQDFRLEFLSAVIGLGKSSSRGMFIDSCYAHCQTETQTSWFWPDSPRLDRVVHLSNSIVQIMTPLRQLKSFWFDGVLSEQTIAKAVGDWVCDRTLFQMIDCPYPCNPTCHNTALVPQDSPPL